MLRLMRSYASSWLIKVILGSIVIVFIFWGVGSFRSSRADRVALVNGKPVTIDEFRDAYNNLVELYRQRFGNTFNENTIRTLGIKRQALDHLIEKNLLLQEAKDLNFRVSDNELTDAIRKISVFQIAGAFDVKLYRNTLNRYRLTPQEFEISQRESMLIAKLRSFIMDCIKVSEEEARQWYKWENALADIDFVLFSPDKYNNIKPTGEEIEAFFDSNKASYKTEPELKARFLYFDPKTYRSKVKITDDEIKDYYESNPEEFSTPKTVEARHILIKVAQNAESKVVEKARNKIEEILKKVKGGEDFAEMAKKYSEGPSKNKGGYLGTFRKESMVKPFAEKAFSMKAGEISDPVRTRFGWHIIKVEKLNPASVRSLVEAKTEIQNKLTDDKANNIAYDEAEAVYDLSFEGDDLLKTAKERNLDITTTKFFNRKGPSEISVESRNKFTSEAFKLSPMDISDVLDLNDGFYIIQVIEKIPEKIQDLKDVKEKVLAALIKKKQEEKAENDAKIFLSTIKSGKSMSAESKKNNLILTTTGFFKRNDSIPHIGFEPKISEEAFKLSSKKEFTEKPIKGKKGYYVIKLKEKKWPDPEGFGKEKASITKRLLQQKKSKSFDSWLSRIKSQSEIIIEDSFLN